MHLFFNSSLAVGLTSLLAGASPAGATAGICDAFLGLAGPRLRGLSSGSARRQKQ